MAHDKSAVQIELEHQLSKSAKRRPDLTKIWLAAGRPRGRSPAKWAASNRFDPGITASGGPDEPVRADQATARDYAHYLDPRIEPGRICRMHLARRPGSSETMISTFLPACDGTRVNPHYKSGPPMRLYALARVEQIEATVEFRQYAERSMFRRDASRKAVATKIASMRERLKTIEIAVPKMDWDVLVRRACDHYNSKLQNAGSAATPDSSEEFLDRIMVNYLRHRTTSYDRHLQATKGKTGVRIAYKAINKKVYDAIAEAYPALDAECDRQMLRKVRLVDPA